MGIRVIKKEIKEIPWKKWKWKYMYQEKNLKVCGKRGLRAVYSYKCLC